MGQLFSFSLPDHQVMHDRPRPSSVDALSDEDIYAAIDSRRNENAIGFRGNGGPFSRDSLVHPISYDAVCKFASDTEIFAMEYVAAHTSIPIPKVRRVLARRASEKTSKNWLVMDRIDGEPLALAWPKMSWWHRLRVIWTMRNYIKQIHNVPLPYPGKPGRFDALGRRWVNEGYYFTGSWSEPFESCDEMADWFDHRRWDAMCSCHRRRGYIPRIPKFDRTQPLVLCHMDLHLGNIMVDRNGTLWIIDWADAGAYPAWLEYARASLFVGPWVQPVVIRAPRLWGWCFSYMFGNYAKYERDFQVLDPIGEFDVWDEGAYDYEADYLQKIGVFMDVD